MHLSRLLSDTDVDVSSKLAKVMYSNVLICFVACSLFSLDGFSPVNPCSKTRLSAMIGVDLILLTGVPEGRVSVLTKAFI